MARLELANGGTLAILNIESLGLDDWLPGLTAIWPVAVLEGRFRQDLFERLEATIITVPPATP
jgi:hypothetical protein